MNLTGDPLSVKDRASMKDRRAQEAVTQINYSVSEGVFPELRVQGPEE